MHVQTQKILQEYALHSEVRKQIQDNLKSVEKLPYIEALTVDLAMVLIINQPSAKAIGETLALYVVDLPDGLFVRFWREYIGTSIRKRKGAKCYKAERYLSTLSLELVKHKHYRDKMLSVSRNPVFKDLFSQQ